MLPHLPLLAAGAANVVPDPMSHVLPHYLESNWFTNHHLVSIVGVILGIVLLSAFAKSLNTDTSGQGPAEGYVTRGWFAQLFETLCLFIRNEVTKPLLGDMTDRYIKFIWSLFFFILIGNLLGLLPLGFVMHLLFDKPGENVWGHRWGTYTGNIGFTAGLAVTALAMIFIIGIKENGKGFFTHMWPVPVTPPEGVEGFMTIFIMPVLWISGALVFVLELVGLFIKAFALCVRLFANMVAGHLILGSLIVLALTASVVGKFAAIGGAAAFYFLEIFVSFLQAYLFTFLFVIFASLGAVHHDEHDEHHAGLDEGEMPGESAGEGFSGTKSVPA